MVVQMAFDIKMVLGAAAVGAGRGWESTDARVALVAPGCRARPHSSNTGAASAKLLLVAHCDTPRLSLEVVAGDAEVRRPTARALGLFDPSFYAVVMDRPCIPWELA